MKPFTAIQIGGSNEDLLPKSHSISIKRKWRGLSRLQRASVILGFVLMILLLRYYNIMQTPKATLLPSVDSKEDKVPNVPESKPLAPVDLQFDGSDKDRAAAVVEAMSHSWKAYKMYAWGKDEVHPLTQSYSTWMNAGLTLVDSLDTLWLLGMKEQFSEATEWVKTSLHFDINKDNINVFETTIRLLGGLLSAHTLSGEPIFLEKAKDLGDRLVGAFGSPSGIPYSDINLSTKEVHHAQWTSDASLSEATSLQLEFNELSRLTKDRRYSDAAMKAFNLVVKQPKRDGLAGMYININTGILKPNSIITLGARGDSYYEYLLKLWVQTGRKDKVLYDEYIQAVNGIKKHMVRRTTPNGLTYIGELLGGRAFSNKMDHLVCFFPGTLAYGYLHGMPKDHVELAKQLTKTCYMMYNSTATGLSPEIAYFNSDSNVNSDIIIRPNDAHNLQRPETIESLYYLYQITRNPIYKEWGWKIFQAFQKYTRVEPAGYVSINDVTNAQGVGKRSKCESFWLAETLKYFYLLFDPQSEDKMSLKTHVFNTEAHPFPLTESFKSKPKLEAVSMDG